jgi:hypothetical protein
MKGYKNWCNAMTSASTMVETMLKSSVRYVHQMAIVMYSCFFLNSPSELTFWITLIYKLAAGKKKNITQLTTLRKPDGLLTADIRETLQHMLEYFVPEDKDNDDTDFHTQARTQSQEPMDTAYDKDFNIEEIRNAVESMGNKTAPREDRIMCEIYKSIFEIFPSYITALYNGCLRRGVFQRGGREQN